MDVPCLVLVALVDEDASLWRPVAAERAGPGLFRLTGSVPAGELWEFQPGETVRCVERLTRNGSPYRVAMERVR
jgi:hypothetical protein